MKKIAALLLWLTIEIDRYWTFLIWHLIFKEKYIVSKKKLVNSSLLKLELGGGETPRLKYENYLNYYVALTGSKTTCNLGAF